MITTKIAASIERQNKFHQAFMVDAAIKNFQRANEYLANVILHPEQWHSHEMAIESAKELVYFSANEIVKALGV